MAALMNNEDIIATLASHIEYVEDLVSIAHHQATSRLKRIVILGNTGSGKSTLVHYLAGISLVAHKTSGRFTLEASRVLEGFEIGHGVESRTAIPVHLVDPNNSLVYWDCPGFYDSRGCEHEIINAFAIDKVFTAPCNVAIILTLQESDFDCQRGMSIVNQFSKLIDFIPDLSQLCQAIRVVMTKKSDHRFTAVEKLECLCEDIESSQHSGDEKMMRVLHIIRYICHNHVSCLFTLPVPHCEGIFDGFVDHNRLVLSLKSRDGVRNPSHTFSFDPSVEPVLYDLLSNQANVAELSNEFENLLRSICNNTSKNISIVELDKLLAYVSVVTTVGKGPVYFFDRLRTSFPSLSRNGHQAFQPLFQKFKLAASYISFVERIPSTTGFLQYFKWESVYSVFSAVLARTTTILRETKSRLQLEADFAAKEKYYALQLQESKHTQQELDATRRSMASINSQMESMKYRAESAERDRQNALSLESQKQRELDNKVRELREANSKSISTLENRIRALESENEELRSRLLQQRQVQQQHLVMGGGGVMIIPGFGIARGGYHY